MLQLTVSCVCSCVFVLFVVFALTWLFHLKVKVKQLSHAGLFVTLWAIAYQAPLSMGFSRQDHWSGMPFPSSGHLPDSGIEPTSPASPALSGRFFTTSASWEALSSNEASPDSLWEGHPPPSAHSLLLSFFFLRGRHNVSSYSTRV